jgi:hypothetical protein
LLLPKGLISAAITNERTSQWFKTNMFNNKRYFCFDDNPIFDTPIKKQFNNNHPYDVTIIPSNHFRSVDLKWLHKYLTGPVTRSTHPYLNEASQGIFPEQTTTSAPAPSPSQSNT